MKSLNLKVKHVMKVSYPLIIIIIIAIVKIALTWIGNR